ncbi:hypothetical protein KFL_014090010 [Klebsormidium nitens]|uniref:Integrase catalytic domain-containing protein n=1 Tax=Klebsormidium nitens TaxID=105231 RepID=A0A1Y1IWJ0_KLENI|nr:hypothetical protein KFL_014090010 [Klebsormidium nitens]|eukprot:GAQ93276.1 hypothetical protein KFL_014090010 [Klebsormidium nitens]
MDICGPTPVLCVGDIRYFATFLDDYSKLSVVVFSEAKEGSGQVFGGKGTVHENTAWYTSEENGSAERLI